jgi:flagellar motor switch protein FliM
MENVEPSTESAVTPAPQAAGSAPSPAPAAAVPEPVKAFDFRHPSLLTAGQLRKLQFRHDDFIRSLTTRLSIYFRTEFNLKVSDFQTVLYPRLLGSLPGTTQITLFKVDSLSGIGFIQMSPAFAIALVDRLLGGSGAPTTTDGLNELEVSLLEHAIHLILKEWLLGVVQVPDAGLDIFGHETNPRFLQLASEDTAMLVLSIEARIGETAEVIKVACPFPMLEPIFRQLEPVVGASKRQPPSAPQAAPVWNARLDEVKINLSAAWSGIQIKADTLARLQPGDVLPLKSDLFSQVQVRLAKITKFTGRLGQCNERWAVELSAPVKEQL